MHAYSRTFQIRLVGNMLPSKCVIWTISGITARSYKGLNFNWRSIRTFLSVFLLIGYLFQLGCFCAHMRINKLLTLNPLMFHLESVLLSALFIYLATQWRTFSKQWFFVELSMKRYGLESNMKRKISIVMLLILGLTFVEHALVTSQSILLSMQKHPNSTYEALQEYFVHVEFVEIFYYLPYSAGVGVFFKILIVQKTFMWSFVDIFIIVLSIYLNFRLQQISHKLMHMSRSKVINEHSWSAIREDYVKLSRCCELMNSQLCWLIILTFFFNLYHILAQLFSSLRPLDNSFHKTYVWLSFLLLIIRVTSVCFFGGSIYDEHEHIMFILSTVPTASYNIEVERFLIHLNSAEMALTGKNFFKITRGLILKVTSAIVTYELVLIQFNQQEFKTVK
ncbi:gustatory receptor for sugar taste 64f [Dendroctonus ponderosae]|uniref:gustatory receptor for sugar taste 64f n=1 Tax=Dendroctonus ponderosae TaxID=77166 RepID=UPI0020365FCC|nr:gustatory receptor for sugar taste 64f [Dendroctonus ponderosae]KAH1012624.1 hypothetical protein HUJ05_011753 [Dendroctonus ponderosae]